MLGKSAMDDVDRLFQCFKCGVSPPESAMREKKTSRNKVNSRPQGNESPSSARKNKILGSMSDKENKRETHIQVSPVVFYGSPHGVPPKRPSSFLRLLREIRIDLAERRKSNLRKQTWATFPKQDEAMNFMKEQGDLRIFSYQDHFNGQRRFLVSSYNEFWKRYKSMNPNFRHHYEVIQEGLPCHLYFDLEFERMENPDKDGNQMVDLLIAVVFEALYEKYQIQGDQEWIVELDSSTEAKFSRHLVLRIPKTAFKDNSHAGAFVSEICSRICIARESDTRFQQVFVSKDSSSAAPSQQLFVDNAVYSRNRCFRLVLSSKAGKTSVLLPTGRFRCRNMCEEEVFMASLICNIDDDCEKLLVCKMELDCIKTLQFDTEVNYNYKHGKPSSVLKELTFNASKSEGSRAYLLGTSPFPSLDAFIESVGSVGNVTGKIRSWYWFSEFGLMVYNMAKSRYCERIGREHKSNNVMYVVDLRWALYYQKCYDPDCRGYRSPSRPIPDDVIPEVPRLQHIGGIGGSADDELELVDSNHDHFVYGDEAMIDADSNDEWWLEAIKVADNAENMGNSLLKNMDDASEDDDDEWWMEVERTASLAENREC
uniref:DNA-directed primase/polymerase protein n=1 Tax=Opuntia streptacantha TaxID=393608 RepID=A0A7C9CL28_OPUST